MKILSVRFENLNSLEGHWKIDFTHPAYRNSAIFAITGPTGSGKTTLLDAICLAIYGRTPRLKVLSKSTNELLTRQKGHCFAEVVFETVKGRFRCHWSQHRARKTPNGDLQQPRHEIADDSDGTVLENTIKEVARKVEEVTGMNFDQFTRSILLAQGSFAAFLQAPADERSPLLEQITGTEIYSTISQRVHVTTAEQQRIYQSMLDELNATSLLTPEEEEEITEQLDSHRIHSKEYGGTLSRLQESLNWLESVAKLHSGIQDTEKALSLLIQREEQERGRKETLTRAQQAATLLPLYHRLLKLRSRQVEEENEHTRLHTEQKKLADSIRGLEQSLEIILEEAKQLDEQIKTEQQQARAARALDIKREELHLRLKKEEEEAKELDDQKTLCKNHLDSLREAIEKASSKKEECLHYYKSNSNDARLEQNLPAITERVRMFERTLNKHKSLQQRLDEILTGQKTVDDAFNAAELTRKRAASHASERRLKYKKAEEEIGDLKKEFPHLRALFDNIAERQQVLEQLCSAIETHQSVVDENSDLDKEHRETTVSLNRAEKEIEALAESVSSQLKIVSQQEKIHLLSLRLESYEEERRQLEEGTPCPLCGSTEHPYADNLPVTDKDREKDLQEERKSLAEIQERLDAAKEKAALLRGRSGEYDRQRDRLQKRQSSAAAEIERLCKAASIAWNDDLAENVAKAKTEAASHLALLREKRSRLEQLEKEERSLRTSLETLDKEERTQEKELNTLRFKREALQDNRREVQNQRAEIEKEIERQKKVLHDDLTPFGYHIDFDKGLSGILDVLEKRRQAWQDQLKLEKRLTDQIQKDEKEFEAAKSLFQKIQADTDRQQKKIEQIDTEYKTIHNERVCLYGEKDPDKEEKILQERAEEKRKQQKDTEQSLNSSRSNITLLHDRSKRLERSTGIRAEEIESETLKWYDRLESMKFTGDQDFSAALLPQEQIVEMVNMFDEMEARKVRLTTILEEKSEALNQEKSKAITNASAEELTTEVEQVTQKQQHHLQQIGRLEGRLEENRKAAEKQKTKRQQLAQQKKELTRWQKLDELIGSANGKKFRNFAQGITFEVMVRQANGALRMMTDRYLLIRDTSHPLELNIIDNYRAGDIRSTKNLSGGESFLISLALALGLSKMAGSSIRVDSLFLDEGFGTLDEETLETALQTLAGLQQEGRMIGIISHVSLLKERLETQIQVIPGRGGHSLLRGPGVESI